MINTTRHNEVKLQDKRPSRFPGRRRVDFTTKDSEPGYRDPCREKKAQIFKPLSPEISSMHKQHWKLNVLKKEEKILNQSDSVPKNVRKSEVLNLNVDKKGKMCEMEDHINNTKCSMMSEVESQKCACNDQLIMNSASKNGFSKFTSVTPAVAGMSDNLPTVSSPSNNVSVSRTRQTAMNYDQFRQHVKILVQQQCMLVSKISKLKEELHLILIKMEETIGKGLMNNLMKNLHEEMESAENAQDGLCGSQDIFHPAPNYTVSKTMSWDLSSSVPDFSDKLNFGDYGGHSSNNPCYDKCWNANISREEGGVSEGQMKLDKLLLSCDESSMRESWSDICNSTEKSTSGSVYCQLQYIFLLVLVIVQFVIQFACMHI